MNIILNNSHDKIGGIEVLLMEVAKYLINTGHKVFFIISYKNDIYKQNLSNENNIFFIEKKIKKDIDYYSASDLKREQKDILNQLDADQKYFVISPYYQGLQYAMGIFGNDKRFILSHIWVHPQNWAKSILILRKGFIKKKYKTRKYYYQQKLLKHLNEKNADFYPARIVPVFNSWYYNVEINNKSKIEAFPIGELNTSIKNYNKELEKEELRIVWCGRFDYFKNEAIIQTHKVLEVLANDYPNLKLIFDLIGFGNNTHIQDLRNSIKPFNVEVNYLGVIEPEKLAETFKNYDIGVGMGLTVKKMGQVGLPAIILDSVERGKSHEKNANWLFETSVEGDAGDGYYFKIANQKILSRKKIVDILREIIENQDHLQEYSRKCIEYVKENYSMEKQIEKMIDQSINSKFAGDNYPVFRRSALIRLAYNVYIKLKSILRQ